MSDEGSEGEASTEPKKKKKKKRRRAAAPNETATARPGDGTPDGEILRAAERAWDAGDYVAVRARAKELANARDPDVRAAAEELAARTGVDPVQVVVILACAAVLVTIAWVWVF